MDDIGLFDAIGRVANFVVIGVAVFVVVMIALVVQWVKDARRSRQDPGAEREKKD
jgi:heme exporter protein D